VPAPESQEWDGARDRSRSSVGVPSQHRDSGRDRQPHRACAPGVGRPFERRLVGVARLRSRLL